MSTVVATKSGGGDLGTTSSTSGQQQHRSSDEHDDDKPSEASLKRPRKSLPFLPRTSQYERHPLLQTRSTATGLSEFELLMLEKDALVRRKSVGESSRQNQKPLNDMDCSQAEQSSSAVQDAQKPPRTALVPRGAQYESHPLFVRSESGVCELETYLSEIAMSAHRSSSAINQGIDGSSSGNGRSISSVVQSRGQTTATPSVPVKKLEPRTTQWERHSLLEVKDESGMTELERLLMEKDHELRSSVKRKDQKNKASETNDSVTSLLCPVCGADRSSVQCQCTSSDGGQPASSAAASFAVRSFSVDVCSGDTSATTASDGVCPVATLAQQKRVRFVAQRQKTEPEDVGQHLPATGGAETATVGVDGNNGSDAKYNSKSSKCPSRNRTCRADTAPSGGQRKSCCIS